MPAAGAGLHATRETRNGSRRAKTVVGLKNFILLSKKALGMEAARYNFSGTKPFVNLSRWYVAEFLP